MPPIWAGLWNSRQRSAQSSLSSVVETCTSVAPMCAGPGGRSGSSPGAPYRAKSTKPSPSTCSKPPGASAASSPRTASACSVETRIARRITRRASAQRPLHLREQRLVGLLLQVLGRQGVAQLLQQLALAAAQFARNHHVQDHLLVPAAAAADPPHAAPAQRHDGAGLGAGRHFDLLVAVEGRH